MPENNNISSLFDASGNLTLDTLERYSRGLLTPEEKVVVDKHLAGSPFDREALEGFKKTIGKDHFSEIEALNGQIRATIAGRAKTRQPRRIQRYYWVAAASIIGLISVGAILVLLYRNPADPLELAMARQDTLVMREGTLPAMVAEKEQPDTFPTAIRETAPVIEEEGPASPEDRTGPDERDEVVTGPALQELAVTAVEEDVGAVRDNGAPSVGGVMAPGEREPALADPKKAKSVRYTIKAEQTMQAAEEMTLEASREMDVQPQFPGGADSLAYFLDQNIRYPEAAKESGIHGRVIVVFVIEEDGSVSQVEVLKGIGGGCDEEAVRVAEMMPDWIPAKRGGVPVSFQYVLPVSFILPDK